MHVVFIEPLLSHRDRMFRCLGCLTRIAIFFTGAFVGVLMFPTIGIIFMEDDSSDPMTATMAMIGFIGSILLLIGGIVGAYINQWVTLLPGSILILVALSSIYPYLWAVVVMLLLLLFYCVMTLWRDRTDKQFTSTDDIERYFDVNGYKVLMDIDGITCDTANLNCGCSTELPLISLGR